MAFLEYRPTQTLFQFTSIEGLRGIVESKQLWCTDLAATNDPRELALGYQHFLDAMKFVRENEYKGDIGNFIDVIEKHITHYKASQQTFCACFSTVGDDLPMWREYGSSYSGIAVGFRPTAITSMPGRIQKARYLKPETPEEFRQAVRDVAANFDIRHDPNDWAYWISASIDIFAMITALKHHSWAYENEIRFIHAQVKELKPGGLRQIAEYLDQTPVLWERPLSRVGSASQPVDYKAFPFGKRINGKSDPTKAIAEIVLGPRCALEEEEVRTLLEGNGYKQFAIKKSECQIR